MNAIEPPPPRARDLLVEDIAWYNQLSRVPVVNLLMRSVISPGFLAVIIIRIQEVLHRRSAIAAAIVRSLNYHLTGVEWAPTTPAGPGLHLPHPTGVGVGHGVTVGRRVTILQNVTVGTKVLFDPARHAWPRLLDGCVIGAGACVLGAVTVGRNSIVGANAVLMSDLTDDGMYHGFPSRTRTLLQG